jgi:hypothetical protein
LQFADLSLGMLGRGFWVLVVHKGDVTCFFRRYAGRGENGRGKGGDGTAEVEAVGISFYCTSSIIMLQHQPLVPLWFQWLRQRARPSWHPRPSSLQLVDLGLGPWYLHP